MHSRDPQSPTPALDLPPPFRLVTLREVGDAFAHANAIAAEAGAGTLVHVGRFDLVGIRGRAGAGGTAADRAARLLRRHGGAADALAVHAPPDRTISFAWPDAIRVDGGLVGGGRLAWPAEAIENEPPEWLVFGASIRTVAMGEVEAGLRPLSAALDEEGFEDLGSGRLVEGFARHLMVAVDAWRANGFATVDADVPASPADREGRYPRDIDRNGDLLMRWRGQTELDRRDLAAALAAPSWLDPETGGPRT